VLKFWKCSTALPVGFGFGWMLRLVVESRAPWRLRSSVWVFWRDSSGRRS